MDLPSLTQALWPTGNAPNCPQVYALLDGARDDDIGPAVWLSNLPYTCLYSGNMSRSLQLAAPYLVQLAPESRFFKHLVEQGWGRAWGIFAIAQPDVTLKVLRKHFRTLLRVKDEQGKLYAFRFYDPRVLGAYMPTCTPSETSLMLGPVQVLACESPDGDGLLARQAGNGCDANERQRTAMPMITIRRPQMQALHAAQLAWEAQALLRRHRPSEYAELCRLDCAERSRAIAEQAMACRVSSRTVFPTFACLAWRWGPELNANGADSALHHILTDNWFNGDDKLAHWKARVDLEKGWTWD